jgi:hypothetical protein
VLGLFQGLHDKRPTAHLLWLLQARLCRRHLRRRWHGLCLLRHCSHAHAAEVILTLQLLVLLLLLLLLLLYLLLLLLLLLLLQ